MAAVLLVLAGMHGRVVRHAHHKAAVHAGIRGGEQGIRGHVEPHVLHGGERPGAREGRAHGAFQRHFLVGRPFGVHFAELRYLLGDLGGGSARIGGHVLNARLPKAPGNGLVAK